MEMKENNGAIEKAKIKELEDENNFKLPEDYKQFLMQHNGGYPKYSYFPIPYSEGETDGVGLINDFYGILPDKSYNDLSDCYSRVHSGFCPNLLLPIASDPSGNLICINLNETNYGAIYYHLTDYDRETDDRALLNRLSDVELDNISDEEWNKLDDERCWLGTYLLAKSFDEFAESLYNENE